MSKTTFLEFLHVKNASQLGTSGVEYAEKTLSQLQHSSVFASLQNAFALSTKSQHSTINTGSVMTHGSAKI